MEPSIAELKRLVHHLTNQLSVIKTNSNFLRERKNSAEVRETLRDIECAADLAIADSDHLRIVADLLSGAESLRKHFLHGLAEKRRVKPRAIRPRDESSEPESEPQQPVVLRLAGQTSRG